MPPQNNNFSLLIRNMTQRRLLLLEPQVLLNQMTKTIQKVTKTKTNSLGIIRIKDIKTTNKSKKFKR